MLKKIEVCETRLFNHTIEIETDKTEYQLDFIFECVVGDKTINCLDDIKFTLKQNGVKVRSMSEDDAGTIGEIKIDYIEGEL